MDAGYNLTYLPVFRDDLEDTAQYIATTLGNPAAALKLVDKVEEAISNRLNYPEAFEPYYSSKDRTWPYYRIYVGNYVVYYVVTQNSDGTKTMEVRRFLYGGSNRPEHV